VVGQLHSASEPLDHHQRTEKLLLSGTGTKATAVNRRPRTPRGNGPAPSALGVTVGCLDGLLLRGEVDATDADAFTAVLAAASAVPSGSCGWTWAR
jgi:hypothetical protein